MVVVLFIRDCRLVCPTCSVCAACSVKRAFPESDLMSYDGKAVDISFLRGALCPQMLWGCPQVWEREEERKSCEKMMEVGGVGGGLIEVCSTKLGHLIRAMISPLPGLRKELQPKSVIFTTMRLSTTQLVDLSRPCTWMSLEWRYDMPCREGLHSGGERDSERPLLMSNGCWETLQQQDTSPDDMSAIQHAKKHQLNLKKKNC